MPAVQRQSKPRQIWRAVSLAIPNCRPMVTHEAPALRKARISWTKSALSFFARFGLLVARVFPLACACLMLFVPSHHSRFAAVLLLRSPSMWLTSGNPCGFGKCASATMRWISRVAPLLSRHKETPRYLRLDKAGERTRPLTRAN